MNRVFRGGLYVLGVFLLAVGITLNTKTGLGVSPIISVAYSVSEIWNLNFGMVNFFLYCGFVGAELLLLRRMWVIDLLQLPFSFVFSALLGGFGGIISYNSAAHGLLDNLALLVLAITLTGAGISLTVNMRLVPNPGDGIVYALAQHMGWKLGLAKNIFDLSCVLTTCVLGLCFGGEIIGIGLGTLATMAGTGRAVAAINGLWKEKMCRVAGVA
ncbi:MAG: DUF6198 family protein [Lawsonibacter sp.]|nr:DUF6198 family protein [Lawsonibacter sp.]